MDDASTRMLKALRRCHDWFAQRSGWAEAREMEAMAEAVIREAQQSQAAKVEDEYKARLKRENDSHKEIDLPKRKKKAPTRKSNKRSGCKRCGRLKRCHFGSSLYCYGEGNDFASYTR